MGLWNGAIWVSVDSDRTEVVPELLLISLVERIPEEQSVFRCLAELLF